MDGKVCTKCGTFRTFAEFPKRSKMRDGHDSNCKPCYAAKSKEWVAANKGRPVFLSDEQKAARDLRAREWRKANPERAKQLRNNWRSKNWEKARASEKACYEANRDKTLLKKKEWQQANKPRYAAYANARRAAKLQATPSWVNHDELLKIYQLREQVQKATGVEHHVDHIVPLISPVVCGLHVPWNLRVIDGIENRRKSNKLSIEE